MRKLASPPKTFEEAVSCFLKSLSDDDIKHFLSLKAFNRYYKSCSKYWNISYDFGIYDQSNMDLLVDIARKNPEKALNMDFLAEIPDEFHATIIILEKAKEVLESQDKRV
ncbi:hypothetical protein [Zooshikella ganghwensis]|uniref:hypothetical protein n=1 Tax=Zooshikella ganghwensis TaxID=202772 RepID=UPI0003FA2B04|nr:hypothetical protein [Zooshikella ganghwensis]